LQEIDLRLGSGEIGIPETAWPRQWCSDIHVTSSTRSQFSGTVYEVNVEPVSACLNGNFAS